MAFVKYLSISAAREAATVPFQVQVDLGTLFLWHKNIFFGNIVLPPVMLTRFPELRIFHSGSSDGSGAPIWEPWG